LGDMTLVNLSVWRDVESLQTFVYKSAHARIMTRRKEWFERMANAYFVLWWVPYGHRPSFTEAAERLAVLKKMGSTPAAFTFRQPFPPLPERSPLTGTDRY